MHVEKEGRRGTEEEEEEEEADFKAGFIKANPILRKVK